ncbi:PASTA domain-containing protein [Deinococcus maricopensis]|uniref:PASTA domain containing protein n=1 Tax=Deinococcus maricopensis (strain DSM 21211 / LMG 22137 / NRRL B-23946 / LB-34) TaxID=709986 RepID=E8U6A5_DEIML|nr:PASTA domain-containing protein [Deinococcus maricopensis]ADV66594.1 PASTA domain containing protein [Deinococcus maricopensis DSM 21211]
MSRTEGRIDGKYEVTAELAQTGQETLYAVTAPRGDETPRRLGWFSATTPAERQAFHTYRAALRALQPDGLEDVVARPGAFYALWRPVPGAPLDDFLAQPVRAEEAVEGVRTLAARLAEHGYALQDAEVSIDGPTVRLGRLAPVPPRTPDEVSALNARTLAPLGKGRVRRKRRPLSPLAFLPGLLFLGGAGYLGAEAARTFLNPPVREVPDVAGQPAEQAARALSGRGFRVQYVNGEGPNLDIGDVVSQNPAGGSNLPVDRLVTLTVNDPKPVPVPKLEELNLDQVRAALAENRLKLGTVTTISGALTNTPKGRVIAQVPEAGSTSQRGQPVNLLISDGLSFKQTWLPDLSGMTFDDAREMVRKAGLVVNRVRTQTSDARENTVLTQDPKPYAKVDVGSPVTLTVARARVQGPSRATSSLPLPPAPVQPEPDPEPTIPDVPAGEVPAPPDPVPATPPTTTPAAETRRVNLNYTFPSDLPSGTVDIVVRDADGERVVFNPAATTEVAGALAQQEGISVRGDALFVVRVNGQDFTSFTP